MIVEWGELYSGPGAANPCKSRSERHQELVRLLNSDSGPEVIEYYFALYTGILAGNAPPVGAPMLKTILDHEYPEAAPSPLAAR